MARPITLPRSTAREHASTESPPHQPTHRLTRLSLAERLKQDHTAARRTTERGTSSDKELLPEPRLHPITDERLRQSTRSSTEFFTRPVTEQRLKRLGREGRGVTQAALNARKNRAETNDRAQDRAELSIMATPLQRQMMREFLGSEPGRQLREEVRLDSVARTLIGKEPYDLTRETIRRALPTVRAQVRQELQHRYQHRISTSASLHVVSDEIPTRSITLG